MIVRVLKFHTEAFDFTTFHRAFKIIYLAWFQFRIKQLNDICYLERLKRNPLSDHISAFSMLKYNG